MDTSCLYGDSGDPLAHLVPRGLGLGQYRQMDTSCSCGENGDPLGHPVPKELGTGWTEGSSCSYGIL